MLADTDYLVIGAGATGLAFADTLLAEGDAEVTVVDRRPSVGGHWIDAYPFVRLHTPSAYYGVDSMPLGRDQVDESGENAGFYERASGEEVFGYFVEVAERLERTGRAHFLTSHEHLGNASDGEQIRDLRTGDVHEIDVRRKVVDARYLEASIPATHSLPFEVAAGARLIPVNDLPATADGHSRYAVLGSGKTAADACSWLLADGVDPERIRWVRPRDAWFNDRRHYQPLAQVGSIMDGIALDAQAAAEAQDLEDLFARLEASGRAVRIDAAEPATMFRGTMLSSTELEGLRQIEDVVRLGRVRRVEPDRIVLDRGEIAAERGTVYVDCTALGLNQAPATPIFQGDRIVLQQIRHLSPCFNAALTGFLEAHRDDESEKNRLCPPNPYPSSIEDWPRMMRRTWQTEALWLSDPELSSWATRSRLNLVGALPEHASEPDVQDAVQRYLTHVGAAIERLGELAGAGGNG